MILNAPQQQVFYADDFHQLRELNLDNNFVSDMSSLACLTNLCALRLNHNRMEGNPIYKEDEIREVRFTFVFYYVNCHTRPYSVN